MSVHIQHLTPKDLSARWHIAMRTLDNWRWRGEGPRYLKIGGRRVVYRLEDIEAYEAEQLRLTETESSPSHAFGTTDTGRGPGA